LKQLLLVLCLALVVTSAARAGTTGVITGSVTNENGAPVTDALVTATSASDIEKTTTDQQGHFAFLRLPPDIYTIAFKKNGLLPTAYAGITVFADNSLALSFKVLTPRNIIIACVDCGWHPGLVRSGVGSDFYSIYPSQFNAFQDALHISLSSIPGITFGNGGPIPH
jgi:hypothetical protein